MSPLSGFLAVIVFFTAILVAYLTKQFQNENLNYSSSNQMKKIRKPEDLIGMVFTSVAPRIGHDGHCR